MTYNAFGGTLNLAQLNLAGAVLGPSVPVQVLSFLGYYLNI